MNTITLNVLNYRNQDPFSDDTASVQAYRENHNIKYERDYLMPRRNLDVNGNCC